MASFYFWTGLIVVGMGALAATQEKIGARVVIGMFALGWVSFAVVIGMAAT